MIYTLFKTKKRMKTRLLNFTLLILLTVSFTCSPSTTDTLKVKAKQAATFCKTKGFNTDFCVLIDMSIHSGKNRLFIYDLKNDSIISKALCAHGSCSNLPGKDETDTKPTFSNTHETLCSSLGKYKIGKRGYSNWGVHFNYKLHGLEATNSNAYARTIVLHSWEEMPNKEVYPQNCPNSWGCPMVSDQQMRTLDKHLKPSKKPVLLWIYK